MVALVGFSMLVVLLGVEMSACLGGYIVQLIWYIRGVVCR